MGIAGVVSRPSRRSPALARQAPQRSLGVGRSRSRGCLSRFVPANGGAGHRCYTSRWARLLARLRTQPRGGSSDCGSFATTSAANFPAAWRRESGCGKPCRKSGALAMSAAPLTAAGPRRSRRHSPRCRAKRSPRSPPSTRVAWGILVACPVKTTCVALWSSQNPDSDAALGWRRRFVGRQSELAALRTYVGVIGPGKMSPAACGLFVRETYYDLISRPPCSLPVWSAGNLAGGSFSFWISDEKFRLARALPFVLS